MSREPSDGWARMTPSGLLTSNAGRRVGDAVVFPYIFLVWLIQVAGRSRNHAQGAALVFGYVILVASASVTLAVPRAGSTTTGGTGSSPRRSARSSLPSCRSRSRRVIMGVFVSAVTVIRFGERGLVIPRILTVLAIFLPPAVHFLARHDRHGLQQRHGDRDPLDRARDARLRSGDPRQSGARGRPSRAGTTRRGERADRIARDLHDLLGHSLTTITVKAELASRLARHDVAGRREIGEVAALSRRALGDVRAAAPNYREVTLAGELATGRELLRAAGIAAELPPAVDVVDDMTQELFGWVLREGPDERRPPFARASCVVRISPSSVEIVDDGVGMAGAAATGSPGSPNVLRQLAASSKRARRHRVGGGSPCDSPIRLRVTIRLLLADDQELSARPRRRCSTWRRTSPSWPRLAGVTRSWTCQGDRADVGLLDIEMPGIDGLAARQSSPNSSRLSRPDRHDLWSPGYLRRAMESGACGFVVKDTPSTARRRHPPRRIWRAGRRSRRSPRRRSHMGRRRLPLANAMCLLRRGRAPRWRRSPHGCSFPKVPFATTSRRQSPRQARATAEAVRTAEGNGWL